MTVLTATFECSGWNNQVASMELSTYFHNLGVLHIIYILSLGPLTLARPYKQKHALFHNTHTLKDIIFTRNLLQDTRSSRVGCASNCHINRKCRSYIYNKVAHRCRTHSDTFTVDDTGGIEEMGWEYYGIRMSSVKRKQAKKNANEMRTPITTTAPGMGGGLKFAQNVTTTPMPDEDDFTDDEDGDDINTTQGSLESSSEQMQQSSEKRDSSTRGKETTSSSKLTSSEQSHGHYQITTSNSQTTYLATQPSEAGRHQSPPSNDMEGVTTRTTEAGPKLTIRKVTSSVRTATTTEEPDSKHGGNTGTTHSPKETDYPSISTMERSSTNNDHITDGDKRAYTSPATKEQTEISALGTSRESGYYAGVHNAHPTPPPDKDFHDHLGFLSTHEQSAVTEMSTGLVIPDISEIDGDEDDESVTIVLMVGDDDDEDDENDEDDPDETSSLIVNAEPDTTMSVITIDSHAHIHGGDDDADDGIFDGIRLTTDLLGITLQSKSKKNKMSEKSHVMRDVPYAVAKETEALERTKSEATKSHPISGSSTANIVAIVTIGLVLPIVGIGAYALYRKRKTGSWTLLTRNDDNLGLQLIKTMS